MLKRLEKTHRRNLRKPAWKQEMLKRLKNVEKTQEDALARSSTASPEAGNVGKKC